MARYALGVEYDGTRYCGWQRQKHSDSVQAQLEAALSRVEDCDTDVFCAGRTDTGVHASGQVVHLDSKREPRALVLGVNSHLPADVSVAWAMSVPANFHARFDAIERRYRYLIRADIAPSALFANRAWTVHASLDVPGMRAAARSLLGEHDFSAFRAAGCQARHPVREVRKIDVRQSARWIVVDIAANAFLQHMVRNIVGLLVEIGSGKRAVQDAATILAGHDRRRSAAAAPACGLYLTQVIYPVHFALPTASDIDADLLPVLPLVPSAMNRESGRATIGS
ncbi:MAG: tRNA pseudouridine(38-40) synthase TruA [Pseudomonadota bacterium]